MKHIKIMLQGAIVARNNLHEVLDEDKLRCEMRHRYQAVVLILKWFLKISRIFGEHKKPFIIIKQIHAIKNMENRSETKPKFRFSAIWRAINKTHQAKQLGGDGEDIL